MNNEMFKPLIQTILDEFDYNAKDEDFLDEYPTYLESKDKILKEYLETLIYKIKDNLGSEIMADIISDIENS